MRISRSPGVIVASVVGLLCAAVLATATTGGTQEREPLPFGTPPVEWTSADGREIVDLMPEEAGVSTLDGQLLRDSTGQPITVPLGANARGQVSDAETDAQIERAMRLQAKDACERGLGYPIGGSASGDKGLEATIAEAKRNRKAAVAANGGDPYRDACDVYEEMTEKP